MAGIYHLSTHPLTRKLGSTADLSDDEKNTILNLPMQVLHLRADQDVVREGDRPSRSFVVLEGFTCTYSVTGDGKRQIQAFQIAGDIPDLHSLHLGTLDNSVGTIAPCTVGFIPHEALRALCERHPRIAAVLWRNSLIEAAVFRQWMTNIGCRQAYSRMAHFFCEMMVRLKAIGLADEDSCDLPMTQGELGDALGLTTVHVNRTLKQLRADGLIETRGTRLNIPDWEELKRVGDFDPTYLHLEQATAGAC